MRIVLLGALCALLPKSHIYSEAAVVGRIIRTGTDEHDLIFDLWEETASMVRRRFLESCFGSSGHLSEGARHWGITVHGTGGGGGGGCESFCLGASFGKGACLDFLSSTYLRIHVGVSWALGTRGLKSPFQPCCPP
ncbi:hypothetical protein BDP81DRAFT_127514 [Colletotrichum phormii]|uniref:Secreted protein n=1 Tax=Colletotrichum phormii TaxID=359342 RepID=A0AAJ0EJ54_9PEZI|nr:uncharacterized protein BDP81DRAFT_127514 [Colletotrichum phormii]KAK1641108.1 hypothetical protein BDP81DRAFT_127514 [Colletotrichum phormii]